MNFTGKIAEQCNGAQHCDLSSQPTYIHKCGKVSDYLYVSYKCISEHNIYDICQSTSRTFRPTTASGADISFYIRSSEFPDEYPWSLDCSCAITSAADQALKLEVLWFSLQDNDYLTMFNRNLTGWINPTYEMATQARTNIMRFVTDDALAYKGFWLKLGGRKACRDDWQLVGDNCVKVFTDKLDWRSANTRCQQMNGNLLKVDDVVADLKLSQYMKSFYPEVDSYWIGLRKYVDAYNKERWMWSVNSTNYDDVSWWPWTPKVADIQEHQNGQTDYAMNSCVVKTRDQDGYFTTRCDTETRSSFVCQTDTLYNTLNSDIHLNCGPTGEVDAHLAELAAFEKIGASSIQNYENGRDSSVPTLTVAKATTEKSILIEPIELPVNIPVTQTTVKSHLLQQLGQGETNQIQRMEHKPEEEAVKLNTTVLAGIITGIGLVIVVINMAVLFICRRNLKRLLKSNKQHESGKLSGMASPDILQDYFEAFSTLHNMKGKDPTTQLKMLNDMNTALTLQQMKTLPLNVGLNNSASNRTTSTSSGEEPLMLNESAKLFYNSQFFKNMTMKHAEATIANANNNGSSAFKPFMRDAVNDKTLSQQQLLQPLHGNFMNQIQNQYDKITHIQTGMLAPQCDSQYAHTYECLDNDASKRLHRNGYNNNNQSTLSSPNENNHTNVSTSSTSSSSGASSTQHLIRTSNHAIGNLEGFVSALTPAQLAIVLNNNGQQQQQMFQCACGASGFGGVCHVCGNTNGSWSPDSAYYSSIPNYAAYNAQHMMAQQQQQQQQFTSFNLNKNGNSNNNNENFKSHLV